MEASITLLLLVSAASGVQGAKPGEYLDSGYSGYRARQPIALRAETAAAWGQLRIQNY
jgi:hypothetical protein